MPKDKRDRWGRLLVTRRSHHGPDGTTTCELELRVVTFPARGYSQRRLGAVRRDDRYGQPSAVMDLGEAVQTAVERGLPLLLSTEAAGHLADTVRVGRMKGRPGALTITSSDGLSATTRRVVAEQAIGELRTLKHSGVKVTLDAGARQLVRMSLARPLADDPVLLGRQQHMAALKVVGSGVDAGQVGSGKTVTSARALSNRATTTRRLRAMIVAEGRLLGQWHDELTRGAPGRGLPPLAPNMEVLVIDERKPIAGQIRAFDTALGDRAGAVLVPNGVLDRYPADLRVIPWHLLIADEFRSSSSHTCSSANSSRPPRVNTGGVRLGGSPAGRRLAGRTILQPRARGGLPAALGAIARLRSQPRREPLAATLARARGLPVRRARSESVCRRSGWSGSAAHSPPHRPDTAPQATAGGRSSRCRVA